MHRLTHTPELLDGPLPDAALLRANLRDMARANRFLGGTALSRRAIGALLPGLEPVTLLDVGTGGADIPLALLRESRRIGRPIRVTAVDSRPEVLDAARALHPDLASDPDLTLEVADGRGLSYADGSFDVAHASLVLHHLEDDEAVAFLRELARVARRGIVINDLTRGRLSIWGAYTLAHVTTRNRFTRHDAPLSTRRAYTRFEAMTLLTRADLRPVFEAGGLMGHRWVIAAVPKTTGGS